MIPRTMLVPCSRDAASWRAGQDQLAARAWRDRIELSVWWTLDHGARNSLPISGSAR